MDPTQIIKRPVVTEKSTQLGSKGLYTFEVDRLAAKPEIAAAVNKVFGVRVVKVRTAIMPGKPKRSGRRRLETKSGSWKKALVQLAPGEKIDLLELS